MTIGVISMNGQTWLICGGRDFDDNAVFRHAMHDLVRMRGLPKKVIHGGALGADAMAAEWAYEYALAIDAYYANWPEHGKAAGPIRNQQMLDQGKPDLVVVFPGGRGTADMKRRAEKAGVEVAEIQYSSRQTERLEQ